MLLREHSFNQNVSSIWYYAKCKPCNGHTPPRAAEQPRIASLQMEARAIVNVKDSKLDLIGAVVASLKACAKQKDLTKGCQIHAEILKMDSLQKNSIIGNTLVDMYAKCGALTKAEVVFRELPVQNVVSYNALIAGYARSSDFEQVFQCFDQMQKDGIYPNAATFACTLKACAKNGTIEKGKEIHADIVRMGLLMDNQILHTALMDMYAKCGGLAEAQEAFDGLHIRDVVSWTVMISGYADHGYSSEVFYFLSRMCCEDLLPDMVTFASALRACGYIKASDKGKKIHAEIIVEHLLLKHRMLGNALVDMYVKCGRFGYAEKVFDELLVQDVVSWSTLIAGYCNEGYAEEALNCFDLMQSSGITPNEITFNSILKSCGSIRAVEQGTEVHAEIVRKELLGKYNFLGTALVDMYAKCGVLEKAQEVFEALLVRDVVSYTSLITGYVEHGNCNKALTCFQQMQDEGFSPDDINFACILRACGILASNEKGSEIHAEIARVGLLDKSSSIFNALMDMYLNCGTLTKVEQVFDELAIPDVGCWNVLIKAYLKHGENNTVLTCFVEMQEQGLSPDILTFVSVLQAYGNIGEPEKGKEIHTKLVRNGLLAQSVLLSNALVYMYAKCGLLEEAREVLDITQSRDIISWTTLISGYCGQGHGDKAINCFEEIKLHGCVPDAAAFACALRAIGSMEAIGKGIQLHAEIIRSGLLGNDSVLCAALVDMYAKCGRLALAREVFNELLIWDTTFWNALIIGYVQCNHNAESIVCFKQMESKGVSPDSLTFVPILKACGSTGAIDIGKQIHAKIFKLGLLQNNNVLGTALVDMYANLGEIEKAHEVFHELHNQDAISCNVLITGYAEHGRVKEALDLFEWMQVKGLSPNVGTFLCLLKACASIGASQEGEKLHADIVKEGIMAKSTMVGNTLVYMYAKCGEITKAKHVFENLHFRDVVSWTALVEGYVQGGEHDAAFCLFRRMIEEGIKPDLVSFTVLLSACSISGLVENAQTYFEAISRSYGMVPAADHYTCLLHSFANAGLLHKAIQMIEAVPCFDNLPALRALLVGCQKFGYINVGRVAFKHIEIDG